MLAENILLRNCCEEYVERFTDDSKEDTEKKITSFMNSCGGSLLIGVTDKGTILLYYASSMQ